MAIKNPPVRATAAAQLARNASLCHRASRAATATHEEVQGRKKSEKTPILQKPKSRPPYKVSGLSE